MEVLVHKKDIQYILNQKKMVNWYVRDYINQWSYMNKCLIKR